MLYQITDAADPLVQLIRDDPVRPDIPISFRVGRNSSIYILLSDDEYALPLAVVCVCHKDQIPKSVDELMAENVSDINVAVFYTIWSYKPGAGRKLIIEACAFIRANNLNIKKYITLSPPTEMAKIFHLRNGAHVLNVNDTTVNYKYD